MRDGEAIPCERCGGETLRIVYGYPRAASCCRAPAEDAPRRQHASGDTCRPTRKCRACGHRQGAGQRKPAGR